MRSIASRAISRTPPRSSAAAWTTARRITIPLACPRCSQGAHRLPAGDDAVQLPRDLGVARGLSHHDDENHSLFQYPPKLSLRRPLRHCLCSRCCSCAPAHDLDAAAIRLWAASRAIRGWCGSAAGHGSRSVPSSRCSSSRVSALRGAIQCGVSRVASQFISFNNFTLHNINFVLFNVLHQLALKTPSSSASSRPPSARSSRS